MTPGFWGIIEVEKTLKSAILTWTWWLLSDLIAIAKRNGIRVLRREERIWNRRRGFWKIGLARILEEWRLGLGIRVARS